MTRERSKWNRSTRSRLSNCRKDTRSRLSKCSRGSRPLRIRLAADRGSLFVESAPGGGECAARRGLNESSATARQSFPAVELAPRDWSRAVPSGVPLPVQGSHPGPATYVPLLPLVMSRNVAALFAAYNIGLIKPTLLPSY